MYLAVTEFFFKNKNTHRPTQLRNITNWYITKIDFL